MASFGGIRSIRIGSQSRIGGGSHARVGGFKHPSLGIGTRNGWQSAAFGHSPNFGGGGIGRGGMGSIGRGR